MSSKSFILSVISGLVVSVILTIIERSLPYIRQKFEKWGMKKTANLISGIGLLITGGSMAGLSLSAEAQMFAFTGFILPLIHPSIHGLNFGQASIFGNFANFFYFTLIIGGLGSMFGVSRIQKFNNLRSPPRNHGYH